MAVWGVICSLIVDLIAGIPNNGEPSPPLTSTNTGQKLFKRMYREQRAVVIF